MKRIHNTGGCNVSDFENTITSAIPVTYRIVRSEVARIVRNDVLATVFVVTSSSSIYAPDRSAETTIATIEQLRYINVRISTDRCEKDEVFASFRTEVALDEPCNSLRDC